MSIKNPLDSGYISPCKNCPHKDENKKVNRRGGASDLQDVCKECPYRLALIEAMLQDPVPTVEGEYFNPINDGHCPITTNNTMGLRWKG